MPQPRCSERIDDHCNDRMDDLAKLWAMHCEDPEAYDDDLGNLNEYGLCFDYVDFADCGEITGNGIEGFWRYQISTGGPGEEIRFFSSHATAKPHKIEFWLLDWADGAKRILQGPQLETAQALWDWFAECGSTAHALKEAE